MSNEVIPEWLPTARTDVALRNAHALSDEGLLSLNREIELCRGVMAKLSIRKDDQGISLLALYLSTLSKLIKQEDDFRARRKYNLSVQEALQLARLIGEILTDYLPIDRVEEAMFRLRSFLGDRDFRPETDLPGYIPYGEE
jgi:hypothetical protein